MPSHPKSPVPSVSTIVHPELRRAFSAAHAEVYEDYGSKFQERRMSDIAFEPSTSPLGLNEWRLTLICLTLKLALETPKWRTLEQFLGGF